MGECGPVLGEALQALNQTTAPPFDDAIAMPPGA
jgi:hypothetical protein